MTIVTNAVDSFVIMNFGVGHGEGKLYLRGNYTDLDYRNFFSINAQTHGVTEVSYNGEIRYRENGPVNGCYFLGSDIINYLDLMINNEEISIQERERLQNCYQYFNSQNCYTFQINYLFDSQNRSYIGSADFNFALLRLVSVSQKNVVCMENTQMGVKFWLEPRQL